MDAKEEKIIEIRNLTPDLLLEVDLLNEMRDIHCYFFFHREVEFRSDKSFVFVQNDLQTD